MTVMNKVPLEGNKVVEMIEEVGILLVNCNLIKWKKRKMELEINSEMKIYYVQ